MPSKSGRLVNKKELAQIFGVSPQAIDGWLGRGLPFLKKGSPLQGYQFDTSAVIAWKAQQDIEDALRGKGAGTEGDDFKRKLAAEANFAELKYAREAGQLITIEDAESEWTPRIANCRARLLAIPSNIAIRVFAAESVEEAQHIVEAEVEDALNELADGAGEFSESSDSDSEAEILDPEDDSDVSPASEADGIPVGGQVPQA